MQITKTIQQLQRKNKTIRFRGRKRAKQKQLSLMQGPSTASPRTPHGDMELYSHDQIVSIAKKNQRAQQQKKRTQQKPEVTTKRQQPRQHTSPRRPKQHTMPQKETNSKDA